MDKKPLENDRELWELLGKAKSPGVSPFFARNVLREVRAARQTSPALVNFGSFFRRIPAAVTAACALLLIGGVLFWGQVSDREDAAPALMASQSPVDEALVDLEIILALDDLLALEENTLWLDTY